MFRVLAAALFCTFTSLPLTISAQEKVFECGSGRILKAAELTKLVSDVQSRYAAIAGFRASFLQSSYLAALDTSELSSGTVAYLRPGKMKWEYLEPERQSFLTDAETLWLYQPNQRQVFIESFKGAFNSDIPLSFLLGIGNLESDFSASKGCVAADGILLSLKEKKESSDTEEIGDLQLLLQHEKKIPIGARIVDVGGNITAILFKELETEVKVEQSEFKPEFPEGTDRIDRRSSG